MTTIKSTPPDSCTDKQSSPFETLLSLFDFKVQFVEYAQFHHNQANKIIHIIFVPAIFVTALVFLHYLPLSHFGYFGYDEGVVSDDDDGWTAAHLVWLLYLIYYFVIEPLATVFYLPLLLAYFHISSLAYSSIPLYVSVMIHLLSWSVQFYGHFHHEHRAPALFSKHSMFLIQPLVLAPMFIWMELLFACGYKRDLKVELDRKTEEAIEEWKRCRGGHPGKV